MCTDILIIKHNILFTVLQKLPAIHVHPITVASDAQLKNKNRFKNMLPCMFCIIVYIYAQGNIPFSTGFNVLYITHPDCTSTAKTCH